MQWGPGKFITYLTSMEYLKKLRKIMYNLLQGMAKIEELDPKGFHDYLEKYSNTICSRHPIAVLLNVSLK